MRRVLTSLATISTVVLGMLTAAPVAHAAACAPSSASITIATVDYTVLTFGTSSGATTTCDWTVPAAVTVLDRVLVVGGGGGGGAHIGGGGGAGGFVEESTAGNLGVTPGATVSVTVGAGGGGAAMNASGAFTAGTSGSDSIFGSFTAYGGGVGSTWGTLTDNSTNSQRAQDMSGGTLPHYGSGGGGSMEAGRIAGTGYSGQGNSGGTGINSYTTAAPYAGGGGGGAGAVGGSPTSLGAANAGPGGAGASSSITGTSVTYAGGGGGGVHGTWTGTTLTTSGTPGSGGSGGGGAGAAPADNTSPVNGSAGTDGLGGGGGGAGGLSGTIASSGGNGGDGVVIVRYRTPVSPITLSYDANGGTGAPTNQTLQSGVAGTVSTTAPTYACNTFASWNTVAAGSGTSYAAGDPITISANTILYAQWTLQDCPPPPPAPSYSVSYNANGGVGAPASGRVTAGSTVTVSGGSTLSRRDFTFSGWWNTRPDGSGSAYVAGGTFVMPAGNVVLYAQWSTVVACTLTYEYQGGYGRALPMRSQKVAPCPGVADIDTYTPWSPGYTMTGWNTVADGSGTRYAPSTDETTSTVDVSGDLTLYAQWAPVTCTVTYMPSDDGEPVIVPPIYDPALDTAPFGRRSTITIRSPLAPVPSEFVGWNRFPQQKFANPPVGYELPMKTWDAQAESCDVTLYPAFQERVPPYDVIYDPNEGRFASTPAGFTLLDVETGAISRTYTVGNTVTVLGGKSGRNLPTRDGYEFVHWLRQDDGVAYTNPATLDPESRKIIKPARFTMPERDVLLVAQWRPVDYTVTYEGAGGLPVPKTRAYPVADDVSITDQDPARPGYAFTGWTSNLIDGDSLLFYPPAQGPRARQAAGLKPVNPTRSFSMPAQDVTFTANWVPIEHLLTYDANGGVNAPDPTAVQEGATVVVAAPGGMTKADSTFLTWNTQPDGSGTTLAAGSVLLMGEADITVFAQWARPGAALHRVTFDPNGGSGIAPPIVGVAGSQVTLDAGHGLIRDGWELLGWNTNTSGRGTDYGLGAPLRLTTDVILYAQWEKTATSTTIQSGPPGKRYLQATVYFDVLSPKLRPDGERALDQLIRRVKRAGLESDAKVLGWVQPDSVTSNDISLSRARARAVAAYLNGNGLTANVTTKALGRARQSDWRARRATATVWFRPNR